MATSTVPRAPLARSAPRASVLRYPRRSLVLLGGIPGAGKSTLLNRLYGLSGTETATVCAPGGVRVVDSQQARNRLTPVLRRVPYPAWRWVTHVLHYLRVVVAVCGGGPVIVHDAATRGAVRWLVGACCRLTGVQAHLLLIDVDPDEARRGQAERGRMVTTRSFRTHERRWRALLAACARGSGRALPGARSLVVLDRDRAGVLRRIDFDAPAAPRTGPRGPGGTIVR